MKQPLVSIITPCWNGEAFLSRYFESILAQTYTNIELIFINDGSTDRTEEIALSYKKQLEQRGIRFVYQYQENAGQAAALNHGLKLFHGEYLTWPDSDDVMTPDCIEKKVRYLEHNSDVEMVRSNGRYFDAESGKTRRISDKPHAEKEDIFEELLLVHTYGCCGCYMISKELFLKCYPDRNIYESRAGQNWQMLLPAASHSLCGYLDEDLYVVYERQESHSRSKMTVDQYYARWDLFSEILEQSLKRCNGDFDKNVQLVRWNCARQKFYYAISVSDKNVMKSMLHQMKRTGKVTLKEYALYIKKWVLQ